MIDLDVKVRFGRFDLDVRGRSTANCLGIIGPSGAGKTTLLNVIAGLRSVDRGRLAIGGRALTDKSQRLHVKPHRRRIGVVFQDNRLLPHLNVRGNLGFGQPRRRSPAARRELHDAAETLAIDHLLDQPAIELSGGEQRRAALARAILSRPRALLLDEPFTGLDDRSRNLVAAAIQSLADRGDLMTILVSHDLAQVLALTRELWVIQQGRARGCGSYWDLLERPTCRDALRGSGFVNTIDARLTRHNVRDGVSRFEVDHAASGNPTPVTGPLLAEAAVGSRVTLTFRAQDLALATAPVEHVTIQNQWPGRVRKIIDHAGRRLCVIDGPAPLVAELTGMGADHLELRQGQSVRCLVKAQALTPTIVHGDPPGPTDPADARCGDSRKPAPSNRDKATLEYAKPRDCPPGVRVIQSPASPTGVSRCLRASRGRPETSTSRRCY